MQNERGDTPLLVCLKRQQSDEFIELLLSAGANIMISNNIGISPLSFAVDRCFYTTRWLLRKSFRMYETRSLNKKLYRIIKTTTCRLKTFVINRDFVNETILLCITTSKPLYSNNVVFMELNMFLDQMEADKDLKQAKFSHVWAKLLVESISLNNAAIFKSVLNKFDHAFLASAHTTLLYDFIARSNFGNFEFIECLHLILASTCFHKIPYRTTLRMLYRELFRKLSLRNIDKHNRMLVISRILRLVKVTIGDVKDAYNRFGFKEEVVALLQYFQPLGLNWNDYFFIEGLIMVLFTKHELSVDGLYNLDLVTKSSIRRLLFSIPNVVCHNYENFKSAKLILNKVPTLFQMSKHVFQKSVQKFYNVQDLDQFVKTVESLTRLPSTLKGNICLKPPIYYK